MPISASSNSDLMSNNLFPSSTNKKSNGNISNDNNDSSKNNQI